MAISKIAVGLVHNTVKQVTHPLSLGMGAFSYGMGATSLGGAVTGTAASSLFHDVVSKGVEYLATKKMPFLRKFAPALKELIPIATDITLGGEVMDKAQKIGDKFMPIKWNKNRLPNTYGY